MGIQGNHKRHWVSDGVSSAAGRMPDPTSNLHTTWRSRPRGGVMHAWRAWSDAPPWVGPESLWPLAESSIPYLCVSNEPHRCQPLVLAMLG